MGSAEHGVGLQDDIDVPLALEAVQQLVLAKVGERQIRWVGGWDTVSSTMHGWSGLSRQRCEEDRVAEPGREGSEEIRCRKEVMHSGEM